MSQWVTILYSSDLHSRFEGWTRMETIAKRVLAERGRQNVIRLDAGDHGDRSVPLTDGSRGRANMRLLAAAGVDAFVCGNNELLYWPAAHLSTLASEAPFSVLSADLALKGGAPLPGLADRAVVHRAGLKIGLFGLTLDLAYVSDSMGLENRPAAEAAADAVRELRLDGCDLVICLSHMGYKLDRSLAQTVQGIDVIVGGHSHKALSQGEQVESTLLVHAGAQGDYLGRLDLKVANRRVESWETVLLPTAAEQPDLQTQALLSQIEAESQAALAEVVAYLPWPLPHDPMGESPLAELLLQRLKVMFGADAAVLQGGVLLEGLPAGPVTRAELLRICPSLLHPCVAEITGGALLEVLALPESELGQKTKAFGMRGETVVGKLFMLGPAQIDPDKTYRVAMNDYLRYGVRPFTPLRGAVQAVSVQADQLLRDTLAEALTGRHFWPGAPVRVESRKLDGQLRKYVDATVVSAGPDGVVLRAGPDYVIRGPEDEPLLTIPHAIDYHFWPGRQYNLFRFFDHQGAWACDYYNVAMPFAARPGVLAYIDLELDVYFPAGEETPQLLDEDELTEAPYPPELKGRIRQIAESLLALGKTIDRPGGPIWPRPAAKEVDAKK